MLKLKLSWLLLLKLLLHGPEFTYYLVKRAHPRGVSYIYLPGPYPRRYQIRCHTGTSQRQLQPSPLRGFPTATPLQQYLGSSSKHPRHAAGISLTLDTLFGLSVHLTTFWTVHSLLLHYFFLTPSSFQLTAHTPQRSGSRRVNIPVKALSCN